MTRLLSDKKQQYVSTRVWEGLSRPLKHTPDTLGGQSPLLSLTVPISWARAVEAHVSSDVICAELHPPTQFTATRITALWQGLSAAQ